MSIITYKYSREPYSCPPGINCHSGIKICILIFNWSCDGGTIFHLYYVLWPLPELQIYFTNLEIRVIDQLVQYLHNMTKSYIWFPELHKLGLAVLAVLVELGMAVQAILAELGMVVHAVLVELGVVVHAVLAELGMAVQAILAELGVVVLAILALKMWKQHD